ncbi:hypothetical protein N0V82_003380 [Gnomoniopsis sp. IMI 355080]|nr:hypothetical protein N0V82_003380 [Gnomoniopsis sp. IMI 355080]
MNNEQFRRLLLANSAKSPSGDQNGASSSPKGFGGATPSALGSRMKSSIPMTPRSVAGGGRNNDFARQLAERNNPEQPKKKFRTSAPKGSRFAQGYVDRAKERQAADEEEDDKAARIKALEESLKKEEIDQATFEKLRNEIAGGDLSSTHLIKGLDFKLLERVKKGEDVFGEKPAPSAVETEEDDAAPEEDVDDAFEELEDMKVEAVVKEKAKKKGQLATKPLVPGQKRSRDQILAEMKAAREAAKANQLGNRFKKIGAKKEPGSRIERDAKGREVLIIVDEDGNERRKVRKVAAEVEKEREAFKVAPDAKVLGMEVPEYYKKKLEEQQQKEEEDVKMFSDVESDYDPLQGLGSDSDDDASGDEVKKRARSKSPDSVSPKSDGEEGEVDSDSPQAAKGPMPPPPKPQEAAQHPRNYFKSTLISEQKVSGPALNDPSVLAALKKAKTLNAQTKSEEQQKEAEREARLKKMLASADRDDADLDMGFGTNRMDDEEDMEDDGKIKLSAWGGDDDDDERGGGGGKAKRKRGGKKRKGDGNNIADVMKVLEQRKGAEK